jgi:hypothetical protein
MSMSHDAITDYVRVTVDNIDTPGYTITPERRQLLTDYRRLAAITFLPDVIAAMRRDGYRITHRVQERTIRNLLMIEAGIE